MERIEDLKVKMWQGCLRELGHSDRKILGGGEKCEWVLEGMYQGRGK